MTYEGLESTDQLREWTVDCARRLPETTVDQPFGPGADVFRVRGKMFMLHTSQRGQFLVNLKAEPEDVIALCAEFKEITPGYHMNKKHWISLQVGPGISRQLVEDQVAESYLLVAAKLPRDLRPSELVINEIKRNGI